MRAVVVYESLFGNTREVAEAVADGLLAGSPGSCVCCLPVDAGPPPVDVDLLVVGGPTHFWGLSSAAGRAMEREYELRGPGRRDVHRTAAPTTGLRDWLAHLPRRTTAVAAAFDTRIEGPATGGAAPRIATRLRRRGYPIIAEPVGFLVDGVPGPLRATESRRAQAWGFELARATIRTDNRRSLMTTTTATRHPHTPDGEPRTDDGLTFSAPVERDGVTVITAAGTRTRVSFTGRMPFARVESSAGHPLGAFVITDGNARWRPAVDATRLLTTAEIVLGAVLVAQRLARRPASNKALVTMGPGGWVSMKGGSVAVRPGRRPLGRPRRVPAAPTTGRAPLWARVLSAVPLQSLIR